MGETIRISPSKRKTFGKRKNICVEKRRL